MIEVSKQNISTATSAIGAQQLQPIAQKPAVATSSFIMNLEGLDLTPPSVPDQHAEAIIDAVQGLLDLAQDIDEILEQSQTLRRHFHDPLVEQGGQAVSQSIDDFVRSGDRPGNGSFSEESPVGEVLKALCLELDSAAPSDGEFHDASDTSECAETERMCKVYQALLAIAENQSDDPATRSLSNVANQIVHSIITTGIPTTARLGTAYGIEFALQNANASVAARTALGAMAGVLPLLAGAAGLVHDNARGTATTATNISRGTLLLMGGATLCAGAVTGSLATMAPTLLAYNVVQRALSDSIKTWVELKSNATNAQDIKAAAVTLGVTIANAMLAYSAYYFAAPNAGQGVAAQGEGWQPLNDLVRGAIITTTTTAGAFLTHFLRNCVSGPEVREDLRLSLEAAMPGQEKIVKQLFGSYVPGGVATTSSFLINEMLAPLIEATGISPDQRAALSNTISALIDGGQYLYEQTVKPRAEPASQPADIEAGRPG